MNSNDRQVPLRGAVLKPQLPDPRKAPDSEFMYIDVSSVNNQTLTIESPSILKGSTAPSRARKAVRGGDVLFATIRPSLRRIARVPDQLDGAICSTAFAVLRANPELLDSEYLYYHALSDDFVGRVAELQRGSSYPAVSDSDILDQTIPLPPLEEQRRIARLLSTIQRSRYLHAQEYQSLQRLLLSQRESEFTDIEPIATLDEVVESVKYGTSEHCSIEGRGPLVLGITNVKEIVVDPSGAKRFPEEPREGHSAYLERGDLLFVRTNADQRRIGKCAVYAGEPSPAMFASYLLRARVNQESVNPWYLAHYAASRNGRNALRASGSGAADGKFNLNGPSLRAWKFPLPALTVQREIVRRLEVTRTALTAAELSLRSLDSVFQSVLAELVGSIA